jgi:hypothetical protein
MADLSGATLADLQVDGATAPRADLVSVPDVQPDITKHDPVTFAALTGQAMVKTLHDQGLAPTVETITGLEQKALDTATDYHKTIAQQQAAANTDLQKRIAAVTSPGVTKEGVRIPSLTEQEEQAKALVEAQKQQAEQQWGQGASAVAAAKAQPGGIAAGQVSKMSDEQSAKMAAYIEGGHNLQNLHQLFDQMAKKTWVGAGSEFQSGLGLLTHLGNITSPEARLYNAYAESSVIPLAKGLMGDAATTAGRPDVSAKMLDAMPNPGDNIQSGGAKVYMMLDRNINNLQTERDIMRRKGIDTSPIDSQIVDLQSYVNQPEVQKYNPLKNPVVQVGVSDEATANLNAGANAGVQMPQASIPGAGSYNFGQGGSVNDVGQQSPASKPFFAPPSPSGPPPQTAPAAAKPFFERGPQSQKPPAALQWLQALLPQNWDPRALTPQSEGPQSEGWLTH